MKFSDYLTEAGASFYARKQKEEPKEEETLEQGKLKHRIRELMMVDGLSKEEAEAQANEELGKKKEVVKNTTNNSTLNFPAELDYLGIKSSFNSSTIGWSEANENKDIEIIAKTNFEPPQKKGVYFTSPKMISTNEEILSEVIESMNTKIKAIVDSELKVLNANLKKIGFGA